MKIKVIVNSRLISRRGNRITALLEKKLAGFLAGMVWTDYPRQATAIARQAERQGIDTVVAVGGDGTMNAVLNGIIGTDIALGTIPAGTANDLAAFHGIPFDPEKACEVVLNRHSRRVDVIRVNEWHYLTFGGIGAPCNALAVAEAIRRNILGRILAGALGSKLYILSLLYAFGKSARTGSNVYIRTNNGFLQTNAFSLIVGNQPVLGKNFIVSPGATNDDGQFDICLIENCRSRMLLFNSVMKTLRGTHLGMPNVKTYRGDTITISATEHLSFFGDGEIVPKNSFFDIQILPQILNVIVPKIEG